MSLFIKKSQSGAALVLALLIMAAVSAVAVALSILIINEVVGSRGVSYSVKSFYSAEAAIEQGMWIIKDAHRLGQSIVDTVTRLDGIQGTLEDSRVKWTREAVYSTESIEFDLRKDQSAFFDLYNPEGGDPPEKIVINYPDCGSGAQIEASWSGWNPIVGFYPYTYKSFPANCNGTDTILEHNVGDNPVRFRLQIRAFDADAEDITLTLKTATNNEILIPTLIQMQATGEYPEGSNVSASQAIQADVPWILPISGIYSYVLYSESALQKE